MMAEPDLAASIIAINGLTASLINTCYDRLRSIQNTATDLKPAIALLRSFNDVLHNVYMAVYAGDSTNTSLSLSLPIADLINNDDGPLVQCTNELRALERIIDVGNGPLKETSLANVLNNLKKIQAALDITPRATPSDIPGRKENVMYNVDARYSTLINFGGDQHNYYTSIKDNVTDELRQKIHLWLSAPDPSSNHNDACQKRQATTGEWFINGEEFEQWKSGFNSFIWLHGIPGSGKSVLW
ncbi:hypothetical protein PILCRDRAFT_718806 [Piloderma croceum F 1598]|uniref:Nephrocystin 3-like N-terminal domain-containing protein n=1 Tax=Piloderma croceum (strain F 1598) TaxID=765440 RepID=A0A0C3F0W8_PILCF|nr:hypothetical protein PILCRDRAFT_718806 [Piloderma croceum F 1598]